MKNLKEQTFHILCQDKSGLEFKIVIIEEGLSKNGTYYPKETLLKSRALFEGAKVAYYVHDDRYDHLPEIARTIIPAGFPEQVAGIVTNVKLEKVSGDKYGLTGTLKLTESNRWLAEIFKLGLEEGNKEVLGFSIDVYGDAIKETVDGKEVDKIVSIDQVNEITVVTNPAAGGRLERMVASVTQQNKERGKMKENLLKLLMSLRPSKLESVSILESTEEQIKKLWAESIEEIKTEFKESSDLMEAVKALCAAVDSADYAASKAACDKVKMLMTDPMANMTEGEKEDNKNKEGEEEDVKTLKPEIDALKKQVCESTLRAHLAESNLPEATKERIKSRFADKTFEVSELVKEIEDERKYAAKLAESVHPSGLHVEPGKEEVDKLGDAVEGMLKGEDVNKVPRFRSLHEAYAKCERQNPLDAGFKDRLWIGMVASARKWNERTAMKEAIATIGFTEILGDRLRKRMIAEYGEAGFQDWRKICNVTSAKDFYTNRVQKLGGYGTNMPTVAEAGAYTALTSPTDEEATYAVTKRGGLESISMEAVKNDNLKAFQLIPKRLGRGCANTLYQFVFEFVNPATNAAVYDSVALYNAAHGSNLRTAALSYSEFTNISVVLMDMTGYNEANFFLDNKPKYLLVPNELWVTATEIAKSNVAFNGARTETIPNSFSEWGLEVIRVPYWTDSNNYVTMADPTKVEGLEIAFLDGNEEPELLQEAVDAGSQFTNDQIRYKVRHIYGGAIVDWRPFVGNVVP